MLWHACAGCAAQVASSHVLYSEPTVTHMEAQLLLRIQNERSSYHTEQGLSQARLCGLRDTKCQFPCALF